jgi:hypothetical protein
MPNLKNIFYLITLVLFYLSISVFDASAQSIIRLRCKFGTGVATNFDNGTPSITTTNSRDMPDLEFLLNFRTRKVIMGGNQSFEEESFIIGLNSVHILEGTSSGNLTLTTIFGLKSDSDQKKFFVTHSRHMNLSSGPYPSHYSGICDRRS